MQNPGGAATASATEAAPDVLFAAFIQYANDIRHKPPHRDNRDYVMDVAIAFPELGRTHADVLNCPIIQTLIEALKVQNTQSLTNFTLTL
jgi:hypothetical protein